MLTIGWGGFLHSWREGITEQEDLYVLLRQRGELYTNARKKSSF